MNNILAAAAAMGLVTLFTRAFPFLLFSGRKAPEKFLKGARLIPGAVMTVLVLTCLPLSLKVTDTSVIFPWIGAAVVVAVHLKFRNSLLSIFGGTAVYMSLLHFFG